jgi:hypothetical protein
LATFHKIKNVTALGATSSRWRIGIPTALFKQTTMNLQIIFLFLIVHWIADFVLQTPWQSTNKSTHMGALLSHTAIYSLCWLVISLVFLPAGNALLFTGITFLAHTITDYFTSRWTGKLYLKKDYHNFFVVIGFDQILHYTQLILTYEFLVH